MGDTNRTSSTPSFPSTSAALSLPVASRAPAGAGSSPDSGPTTSTSSISRSITQFKVSIDSKPKIVAGAIAGKLREGNSPSIDAIGATCVNHALKAIVAARDYVAEDGFDASCSVLHMDKVGPDAIRFQVTRTVKLAAPPAPTSDFKVAAQTRPASLAGAVANKIRSLPGAVVHVSAIGPAAVLKMIKALALTDTYLQEDNLTCSVSPSFVQMSVNGEDRTGLRCIVITSPRAAGGPPAGEAE